MAKVIVNRQSRSTLLLSISHELRTKAYWLVSENWSSAWRACMKRLDETKRSETRDETPRPFGPRPETHRSETETRPRRWAICPRRDRDETLVRLETVSRPRPHPCCTYVHSFNFRAVVLCEISLSVLSFCRTYMHCIYGQLYLWASAFCHTVPSC